MKLNILSEKRHLLLLAILLLALALRLAGIWRSEMIDYHPDEWVLAKPIFQIANLGRCDPKTHYKWPGLSTIYTVGYGLRIVKPVFGEYSYNSILIILRAIAALCGTLTVLLSFIFMRKLFDYRSAIITAAIIATSKMFVIQDHYGTITTLVGTMLMAVFILCYDFYSEQSSLKRTIKKGGLIGVICGWGIASKWTMVLAVIPVSVSAIYEMAEAFIRQRRYSRQDISQQQVSHASQISRQRSKKRRRIEAAKNIKKTDNKKIFTQSINRVVWRSVYVLTALLITFAIFAPDIFENFPKVKEGLQYEMKHHMTGHYGAVLSNQIVDKLSDIYRYINKSTYYPWGLVGLAGVIYSIVKPDKRKIFLLAVLFLWTAVVLRHKVIPLRHYTVTILIIYCFAGILTGRLLSLKYKYVRLSVTVLICASFAASILYTCIWVSPFWLKDGRIGAAEWIRENAEKDDGVTYVPRDIRHHRWLVPGFNFSKDIITDYPRVAAEGKEQYIIISQNTLNKFKKYPPGIEINKDDWFPDTPPTQQELIFYQKLNDGGGEFELVYKSILKPEFLGLSLSVFGESQYRTLSPASLQVRVYRVRKNMIGQDRNRR
jgi:hypothetical protein